MSDCYIGYFSLYYSIQRNLGP